MEASSTPQPSSTPKTQQQETTTGMAASPKIFKLQDYSRPPYLIPNTSLTVDLDLDCTTVRSQLTVTRNSESSTAEYEPLVLDGKGLELVSIHINGQELTPDEYDVDDSTLTIHEPPAVFTLELETQCSPRKNKSASGLYVSDGVLTTQMESEGFRQFTYFADRPDVMSRYSVTLHADKQQFPVLLSNGNQSEETQLSNGKRAITFTDPHAKPTYLFALVAGDLELVEDSFTTQSGREVALRFYVDPGNGHLCKHGIEALKKSMRWDEQKYGLEYDLDVMNVVAVEAFNMGAMENKGLMIFNSAAVLVDPATATDDEFMRSEAIMAHEYFHNWTGNRVTCANWFNLCLKEGLTVYRDQTYTADMYSAAEKRITDVRYMREIQFAEDAGGLAHPVRPETFQSPNNLYTPTVYRKGARLYDMMHTYVGEKGFRKGMDLYFERHDGQAVTMEDFTRAMDDANGTQLSEQFFRWFTQAGTPTLTVSSHYDADEQTYRLTVEQKCPDTPGQPSNSKEPFRIPLRVGLMGQDGADIQGYTVEGRVIDEPSQSSVILDLTEESQTFTFHGVAEEPTPSLLRNFSAPVLVHYDYSDEELHFLLKHDSDSFARFDAGQQLMTREIQKLVSGSSSVTPEALHAFGHMLEDSALDPALVAEILTPPSVETLALDYDPVDFCLLAQARESFLRQLASTQKNAMLETYQRLEQELSGEEYKRDLLSLGQRRLKNTLMSHLSLLEEEDVLSAAASQIKATNMTDQLSALAALCRGSSEERGSAIESFYEQWNDNSLVMNKWLMAQARGLREDAIGQMRSLEAHTSVDNPNSLKSLYLAFAANHAQFHDPSGQGYEYIADKVIEIDQANEQVAGMLVRVFKTYGQLTAEQRKHMKSALERIDETEGISATVQSSVQKILSTDNE